MGFLDKVKNIFTEEVEEEEEVKVEQIKKEVTRVPIESPSVVKKEEVVEERREDRKRVLDDISENETIKKEEKFKGPVFFTDHDFEDLQAPKKKEPEKEEYKVDYKKDNSRAYSGGLEKKVVETSTFKPTPIISPIYGVLDKNYHKEDIVDKSGNDVSSADGLSFDSVRNKAYGTLESDLEATIFKNSILFNNEESDDEDDTKDLFDELEEVSSENKEETFSDSEYELDGAKEHSIDELEEITMDLTKELDNLLLKKETLSQPAKTRSSRNEASESVSSEDLNESDLFNLIDSMYEEGKDN